MPSKWSLWKNSRPYISDSRNTGACRYQQQLVVHWQDSASSLRHTGMAVGRHMLSAGQEEVCRYLGPMCLHWAL